MAERRLDRVSDAVEAAGLDALVLIPGSNLYYSLSVNQRLTERPNVYLIFPDQTIFALLPAIEVAGFLNAWPESTIVPWTDREGCEGSPAGEMLRSA